MTGNESACYHERMTDCGCPRSAQPHSECPDCERAVMWGAKQISEEVAA